MSRNWSETREEVQFYFLHIPKLFEDATRNMEAGVKNIFRPPGMLLFKTLINWHKHPGIILLIAEFRKCHTIKRTNSIINNRHDNLLRNVQYRGPLVNPYTPQMIGENCQPHLHLESEVLQLRTCGSPSSEIRHGGRRRVLALGTYCLTPWWPSYCDL